ncbi:MAG: tetratricopeptide repeat protein, partial [Planctomycetota bacterium]
MQRFLLAVLLLVPQAAQAQNLASAKLAMQKGNYAEAEEIYADLAKLPQNAGLVALGLSQALEAQGQYDEALAALDPGLKAEPDSPDLL